MATACSNPPEGRARWTLELLAGAMVKLTEHADLSRERVRRRLAENHLKPWRKDMWCIPQIDGTYVARMEDVLDLGACPRAGQRPDPGAEAPDPKRPVVCFDESPTQLIGEVRQPIPAAPGQLERYDCEYRRNGTLNLFVFLDAHRPWRKVKSLPRRRPGSPTIGRDATSPTACARLPMSIIHKPNRSASSSITSRPIPPARSMKPSRHRRLDGCCAGSSSTTRPNTPAGSTPACAGAGYGRNRDRRAARPVPRPAHRRASAARRRNRRLGATTQRGRGPRQMDVHNPTRPRQTRPRLPRHR